MKKLFITGLIGITLVACGSENTEKEAEENEDNSSSQLEIKGSSDEPQKTILTTVEDLIPEGMVILAEAEGDLNGDEYLDKVLVLKMAEEETYGDAETARNVMILVQNENSGWEVKGNNPNVVYCQGCGGVFGDPFESVSIFKQSFSIHHYGGSADRWSREITFEYSDGMDNWVLIEDLGTSFSAIEPNSDTTYTFHNKDGYSTTLFDEFVID